MQLKKTAVQRYVKFGYIVLQNLQNYTFHNLVGGLGGGYNVVSFNFFACL